MTQPPANLDARDRHELQPRDFATSDVAIPHYYISPVCAHEIKGPSRFSESDLVLMVKDETGCSDKDAEHIISILRFADRKYKMVERASRAYWNAGVAVQRWDDETEEQREIVRYRMRKALEAMCEPTETMSNIGREEILGCVDGDGIFDDTGRPLQNTLWKSMIGAALKE